MKQLIDYVKTYYHEEFKWQYGLFILLFGLLLLYLNYFFPATREIHRYERWKDTTLLYHLAVYGIPFVIAVLVQKLFYPAEELRFIRNYRFWLVVFFGLLLWSARGGFIYYYIVYLIDGVDRSTVDLEFYYRIIYSIVKIILSLASLVIFWWLVDRKEQPLYGMRRGDLNLGPYLVLLALLIPGIVIAAHSPGFLKTYPRFLQLINTQDVFNSDYRQYILAFEGLYILDFYTLELFFRGFMILALLKYAGPKVILPTAVFYCCLHFGKPFGEALSSLFGGTILGIITHYSRSIWGGIIVHMGIAAAMEVSAYVVLLGKV